MRTRVGAGALLALLVAAVTPALAGQGAPAAHPITVLPHSAPDPPASPPPSPDPLTQPLQDGCQRDPGALLTKQSPEWVYVYNTDADQPLPAPLWMVGTVSSGDSRFQAAHTAGGDLPMGHNSYDFNINILPDAGFTYLVAGDPVAKTGAFAGPGEDFARLHTEWEDMTVAKFAWPEPGDRIAELGSWVWDCGHWGTPSTYNSPDYILPKVGQPCLGTPDPAQCRFTGEGTEFHPYRALWVQRAQSVNSPTGETEAELFISTEKTIAGQQADCAHKNPPPSINAVYPATYGACLASEPNWQDVSGDYSFLLPAPPKPSSGAVFTFRQVDAGSTGGPSPTLRAEGDALRVTFHVSALPNQPLKMAYRFFAGWNQAPAAGLPTHLHVTFDKLEIHRAMDPGCTTKAFGVPAPCDDETKKQSTRANQLSAPPGDWNMYIDVNGNWGQWAPAGGGEFLVYDNDILPGTLTTDIYVPQGSGWRLFVHGRECDLGALGVSTDCPTNKEIADDNDVQGMILDTYASAVASLGTHRSNGMSHKDDPTSTCPSFINGTTAVNPEGCYSLTYTVTAVREGPVVPEAPLGAALVLVAAAAAVLTVRARLRPATLRSGQRDQDHRHQH